MKVEGGVAFEVEIEWGLLPWLGDAAFEIMDVLFGLRVSTQTLLDKWFVGSSSFIRLRSMKGALHEGVQDIR